jgi:hypothetical protein
MTPREKAQQRQREIQGAGEPVDASPDELRREAESLEAAFGIYCGLVALLRAAADKIERLTPVWTTDRPTVSGLWWRENRQGKQSLVPISDDILPDLTDGIHIYSGGRWAGPLPEPAELKPRNEQEKA